MIPNDFRFHMISYDFPHNPTGQLAVVVADAAARPPVRRYVALTGQRFDDSHAAAAMTFRISG